MVVVIGGFWDPNDGTRGAGSVVEVEACSAITAGKTHDCVQEMSGAGPSTSSASLVDWTRLKVDGQALIDKTKNEHVLD